MTRYFESNNRHRYRYLSENSVCQSLCRYAHVATSKRKTCVKNIQLLSNFIIQLYIIHAIIYQIYLKTMMSISIHTTIIGVTQLPWVAILYEPVVKTLTYLYTYERIIWVHDEWCLIIFFWVLKFQTFS